MILSAVFLIDKSNNIIECIILLVLFRGKRSRFLYNGKIINWYEYGYEYEYEIYMFSGMLYFE